MAKKQSSFAEKVAKSGQIHGDHCPVCGELKNYVKQITSVRDEQKDSWRFKEKIVGVCKCNSGDVYH